MLDNLSKNLSGLIKKLVTRTNVDKAAVEELIKELRKILLQADVDTELTNKLIENIRKDCLEKKVPAGLTLREHVLKVIYEELVKLLGEKPAPLTEKKRIMFVGLFGSGKTTSIAKLANYLKKRGMKTALVALDYHRPAAPQQLLQLGKQIGVPIHIDEDKDPYKAVKDALESFKKQDVIIFDTAGRDALDKGLADELKKLGELIKPDEVLLAIPADLGKVARKQSTEFNKLVGITGIVVTKMDGTAKAGGALAATSVTGAKVKFIGTGERIGDLEVYDPERFVSRMLGLGDLKTLMEKAKEADVKEETVEKMVEGRFTLQDFADQLESMQKMGPLNKVLSMVPGAGMMKIPKGMLEKQEEKFKNYKHIISSMTKEERENPKIISAERIKRISKGSGRPESEVRELLSQYKQMKKLMRKLGGMSGMKRGALKNLAKQFGFKM
jgi:signal recognition particle subunit SRP54